MNLDQIILDLNRPVVRTPVHRFERPKSGAMSARSFSEMEEADSDSLESLFLGLGERNVPEAIVIRFEKLLSECSISTMSALRLFSESLPDVANELFDVSSNLGKLRANGFVANVRVRSQCSDREVGCILCTHIADCACAGACRCSFAREFWCATRYRERSRVFNGSRLIVLGGNIIEWQAQAEPGAFETCEGSHEKDPHRPASAY